MEAYGEGSLSSLLQSMGCPADIAEILVEFLPGGGGAVSTSRRFAYVSVDFEKGIATVVHKEQTLERTKEGKYELQSEDLGQEEVKIEVLNEYLKVTIEDVFIDVDRDILHAFNITGGEIKVNKDDKRVDIDVKGHSYYIQDGKLTNVFSIVVANTDGTFTITSKKAILEIGDDGKYKPNVSDVAKPSVVNIDGLNEHLKRAAGKVVMEMQLGEDTRNIDITRGSASIDEVTGRMDILTGIDKHVYLEDGEWWGETGIATDTNLRFDVISNPDGTYQVNAYIAFDDQRNRISREEAREHHKLNLDNISSITDRRERKLATRAARIIEATKQVVEEIQTEKTEGEAKFKLGVRQGIHQVAALLNVACSTNTFSEMPTGFGKTDVGVRAVGRLNYLLKKMGEPLRDKTMFVLHDTHQLAQARDMDFIEDFRKHGMNVVTIIGGANSELSAKPKDSVTLDEMITNPQAALEKIQKADFILIEANTFGFMQLKLLRNAPIKFQDMARAIWNDTFSNTKILFDEVDVAVFFASRTQEGMAHRPLDNKEIVPINQLQEFINEEEADVTGLVDMDDPKELINPDEYTIREDANRKGEKRIYTKIGNLRHDLRHEAQKMNFLHVEVDGKDNYIPFSSYKEEGYTRYYHAVFSTDFITRFAESRFDISSKEDFESSDRVLIHLFISSK